LGIAPEDLPKIFDEFYRADGVKEVAQGTGLGLAIVKHVVDLYGGHLDVESEPGMGSKFRFSLPKGELEAAEETTKTFRDLQRQVVHAGICGKCGVCTAFCSAAKLNALTVDEAGLPVYADEEKCLACGICYLICPVTADLDPEVRRRYKWSLPVGGYQRIACARAARQAIREVGAASGIANALLLYLFENHLVQGVVAPLRTGAVCRKHVAATTREEILLAVGSDLTRQDFKTLTGECTTYSSLLPALKEIEDMGASCVAVTGTPCQIRTIRKMQCLGVSPAHAVGYTLGTFCMGQLDLLLADQQRLEERLGTALGDIGGLTIQEDLCILLHDGSTRRVPLDVVQGLARPACLACTEFASDFADISLGGWGAPDGFSTVMIRTPKGSRVYNGALGQGYIEERASERPTELRSEKTRMLASVVANARRKRERGEARLRELGFDVP
jgi:coenzyme F420 hydrogenase subunit beta